tara:strand:+ start:6693 stop:6944 length:252 start_codon:yes stop_codon:yes gene_type:complete
MATSKHHKHRTNRGPKREIPMDAHNEMLRADNKTLSKRIRDIEALLDEIRELPRHDEARHLIELFLSCGDHAIMDFQGAHHEA